MRAPLQTAFTSGHAIKEKGRSMRMDTLGHGWKFYGNEKKDPQKG